MSILLLTLIILVGAYFAGLLGSLTGLGGGFIIIPLLTLLLNVDIHYAIGASLVSVIATSSGSAAAYVKEGITNMRLGMFLEIATTIGAVLGAYLASYIPAQHIIIIFGLILILSATISLIKKNTQADPTSSKPAMFFNLANTYTDEQGKVIHYGARNIFGGFGLMGFAGMISGLLGIGSGSLKVIAMDNIMRIPFKVSTTTSNFMIGVTAAASAVVYLQRGYIDPGLSMPVMLGVVLGALTGSKILVKAKSKSLQIIFSIVIFLVAIQMIYKGLSGNI